MVSRQSTKFLQTIFKEVILLVKPKSAKVNPFMLDFFLQIR